MGSTISPYQGVKAVALSIFEALHTQAGWLAWIYVLFGVVAVLMLFRINTLKDENIRSDFPAPAFAAIVLSKVHDQAAKRLAMASPEDSLTKNKNESLFIGASMRIVQYLLFVTLVCVEQSHVLRDHANEIFSSVLSDWEKNMRKSGVL
jgi:hypothetical protein